MVSQIKVLCVGMVVETALRVVPVGQLSRLLGIRTAGGPSRAAHPVQAAHLIRATDRMLAFWPRRGRCLRRSLILGTLLRRHDPVLRIGVHRRSGGIQAHAWIEVGGAPVGELGNERFRVLC